jgi:hypothetical protein
VSNASREAVRYATAFGLDDNGLNHYNNCDGIREMAKKSAYFMNLQPGDVVIAYDKGPGTTPTNALCDGNDTVSSGDRVLVSVSAQYRPLVNLVPIHSRTFSTSSARTVLGIFELTP